jgi:hypothetical protein
MSIPRRLKLTMPDRRFESIFLHRRVGGSRHPGEVDAEPIIVCSNRKRVRYHRKCQTTNTGYERWYALGLRCRGLHF